VAVLLSILIVPSLVQELIFRRLKIQPADRRQAEAHLELSRSWLLRITGGLQTVTTEIRGVWTVIKSDKKLKSVRVVVALLVCFLCCCVLIIPLLAAFGATLGRDDYPGDYGKASDVSLIYFWIALIAPSIVVAFVFDQWFKRRFQL